MAVENTQAPLSLVAAADLSAKQFYAVKVTADRNVNVAGASDQVVGVLQNKPTSGKGATVAFGGVTKWLAGGTISAGNRVKPDSNGKCVAVGAGIASAGIAIVGAASGEYAEILLTPGGYAA